MVAIVRELFEYQAYADASILKAIQRHEEASRDREILRLLHHILIAHRFWIHLCRGLPFSVEAENTARGRIDELVELYQQTQALELPWMEQLHELDMERTVESSYLPGRQITVGQALTQVCLHSQGHRAQLAVRLRALGGEPPPLDYILWIKDRPQPSSSRALSEKTLGSQPP